MKSGIEILEMIERYFSVVIFSERQREYLIEVIETALREAYEQGKHEGRRLSEKH